MGTKVSNYGNERHVLKLDHRTPLPPCLDLRSGAPFRARRSWWTIPRVEAPAGHRTRLQPKDCDLQSIRGKIILYLPTRMIWPSGFGAPPVFSTLMANAAADSMGVAVWKLVRIKPSFGTAKTPALTGCEIFGSITHNW